MDDLIGKTFGNLTVLEIGHKSNYRQTYWCSCKCGNRVSVMASYMKSGKTTECRNCYMKRTSERRRKEYLTKSNSVTPKSAAQWRDAMDRLKALIDPNVEYTGGEISNELRHCHVGVASFMNRIIDFRMSTNCKHAPSKMYLGLDIIEQIENTLLECHVAEKEGLL